MNAEKVQLEMVSEASYVHLERELVAMRYRLRARSRRRILANFLRALWIPQTRREWIQLTAINVLMWAIVWAFARNL